MSKRLNISKETKEAIVWFYIAPHTLNETVREFNLSCRQIVKKILSEYNINLHDKQTVNELSSNNAKAAIKEKYGIDNPFCIDKIKKQNAKNHELRISKELSDEIVSFYLMPNSEAKTARNFKLGRSVVYRILIKNNIQFHDRKSTFSFRDAESELTCLKKYGTKNIGTCKFIQEKVTATCKNKYGVEKPLMSEKVRDKAKKTCLDRYGRENPFSANSVKKKMKDACRTRYGVEWYQQTEEAMQKAYKRYLVKKDLIIELSRNSRKKNYIFEDLTFDSLPELAFYICMLEKGANIEREPCKFEYEFDEKTHIYFPDFKVNGQLYEIKGDQFLNEDGTWKNPFDRSKDALWEAKRQCAIKNEAAILYSDDYKKYVDEFMRRHDPKDFDSSNIV